MINSSLMQKRIRKDNRRKYRLPIIGTVLLIVGTLSVAYKSNAEELVQNSPLLQHFLPALHSFNKTSNLSHLASWSKQSTIEIYELAIEPSEIEKLIQQLPFDRTTATFINTATDKIFSASVRFMSGVDSYDEKVKISFLGSEPENWSGEKKAFHIEFPKSHLFNGAAQLDMILPESGQYFIEPLNAYRAKKLGLLSTDYKFIRLKINERDFGVYLASEPWSAEYVARAGNLYDTDNIVRQQADGSWKSLTNKNSSLDEVTTLTKLLTDATDAEFRRKIPTLIDLNKFYKWQLLYALAGENNSKDTTMVFKKETGAFELLPSAILMNAPTQNTSIYDNENLLARRILSDKTFFDEFQKVALNYVHDQKNIRDDLNYYDQLHASYTEEFYNDQAKKDNDYDFTKKIALYRTYIIQNFNNLDAQIVKHDSLPITVKVAENKSAITYTGSFKNFDHRFQSADEFVSSNNTFKKESDHTVVLTTGTHIFNKTVVVPMGLTLIIQPGAELLFGPHVSLISYSPVRAEGSAQEKIYFGPLLPDSEVPWGSFAVMYSGLEKNIFRNIHVNKGGSDIINGVPLASQFTLHDTNTEISDSLFENATIHDSLHATAGTISIIRSTFKNNASDGVDFEHVTNSSIENSFFINDHQEESSGDAIDLATSENIIIRNNKIINFADKGVSVGEHSTSVLIENLLVVNGGTGAAVKEGSETTIRNSIFLNNKTGLDSYRQKQEYIIGGSIDAENLILWNNKTEIAVDEYSKINIRNSTVEGGAQGENIVVEKPDFLKIIPEDVRQLIKNLL